MDRLMRRYGLTARDILAMSPGELGLTLACMEAGVSERQEAAQSLAQQGARVFPTVDVLGG